MSIDRPTRGVRFWLIAILGAVVLFALFKGVGHLGGVVIGAFFAQAVIIALVVLTARRYPPRRR